MTREIKDIVDISISNESESLIQQLIVNFEIIHKNISNLKERINILEKRINEAKEELKESEIEQIIEKSE